MMVRGIMLSNGEIGESLLAQKCDEGRGKTCRGILLGDHQQADQGHFNDDKNHRWEDEEDEEDEEDDDDTSTNSILRFPQHKLFGREQELQHLHEIVRRLTLRPDAPTDFTTTTSTTCSSTTTRTTTTSTSKTARQSAQRNLEIVWLEGYSGTGKSALVAEFARRLKYHQRLPQDSIILFASGKYNEPSQQERAEDAATASTSSFQVSSSPPSLHVPYSGIAQALTSLVSQLPTNHSFGSMDGRRRRSCPTNCILDSAPTTIQESDIDDTLRIHSSLEEEETPHHHHHHHHHGEEEEDFWGDDCLLLPDDIRHLVNIAPGLAPYLNSIDQAGRERIQRRRQDDNDNQDEDGSIQTMVTSNRRRRRQQQQQQQPSANGDIIELFAVDVPQIARAVAAFLRVILRRRRQSPHQPTATASSPEKEGHRQQTPALLVFFLDDLQWMDAASLELLECLWKDPSLPSWMFIGASRRTTNNSDRPSAITEQLETMLSTLSSSTIADHCCCRDGGGGGVGNSIVTITKIPIRNLNPSQILRFVAETLDKIDEEPSPFSDEQENHENEEREEQQQRETGLQEIEPLAEFLYSRTLGNIFYCRQVMKALVRRHIIYYDVMWFEWQFKLPALLSTSSRSGSCTDDLVIREHDIIQMVQDQMAHLQDSNLRLALTVASYIRHSIDSRILHRCLVQVAEWNTNVLPPAFSSCSARALTQEGLRKLLEQGVEQGLLLKDAKSLTTVSSEQAFKFAHDRIQEAAYAMIPPGDERDKIRGFIGRQLLSLAQERQQQQDLLVSGMGKASDHYRPSEGEWMFFAAVDHWNSISVDRVPCDLMEFLRTNFHVGCLCLGKASFNQAIVHFRIVARSILQQKENGDESSCVTPSGSLWSEEYRFCLEVHNRLLETEFVLGNYSETEQAIATVLERATCARDMAAANYTRIQLIVKRNDTDRASGAKEAARLLSEYGQTIPAHPTKADILKERLRLKMVLGARPISCLSNLPIMDDDWQMKLLSQLVFISNMSKNSSLHLFASLRAIRLSLEQGVSKYLLIILPDHCTDLRREGKFNEAYSYATVIRKLCGRFPNERGSEYATSRMILHSGILQLKEPFLESMDDFLDNYRMAMAAGNVEIALTSAMHFPLIYFASGLPINYLLEPKLMLFQSKAQELDQPGFVVIFQLCRQFLWRLQGKATGGVDFGSSSPAVVDMRRRQVASEEETLQELQGHSREMALRDSGILRLVLAYVFRDETEMNEMMDRLDKHPLFDLPLVRQHLRLTFHGLAALTLGRQRRDKILFGKGQVMMKELRKLDAIGSLNARPAYLCLRAVEKHKKTAYDDAIEACSEARLGHLEAIMNEQCALLLLAGSSSQEPSPSSLHHRERTTMMRRLSHEYLENALWLYHDWGASAKAAELRRQFEFLNPSSHRDASGKSSITSFFTEANQRFGNDTDVGGGGSGSGTSGVLAPPDDLDAAGEDGGDGDGDDRNNKKSQQRALFVDDHHARRAGPPSIPPVRRSHHGPPTIPLRSSSPSPRPRQE